MHTFMNVWSYIYIHTHIQIGMHVLTYIHIHACLFNIYILTQVYHHACLATYTCVCSGMHVWHTHTDSFSCTYKYIYIYRKYVHVYSLCFYMFSYIQSCISTYIHIYMHKTHIHAYIYPYLHPSGYIIYQMFSGPVIHRDKSYLSKYVNMNSHVGLCMFGYIHTDSCMPNTDSQKRY